MPICRIEFTVKGSGDFPLDMLRYDRCFPLSGIDASHMSEYNKEEREIRLAAHRANKRWWPTSARWNSFGWLVVIDSVTTHKI